MRMFLPKLETLPYYRNNKICKSCGIVASEVYFIQCQSCGFRFCYECYKRGYALIKEINLVSIHNIVTRRGALDINTIKSHPDYHYACERISCVMLVDSIVNRYIPSTTSVGR